MNRHELIEIIATGADLTKVAATKALDAVIDGIAKSLNKGDPVVIPKLGTFVVRQRSARKGRNPITGEEINIKATKAVGFKAGKALKESVNECE